MRRFTALSCALMLAGSLSAQILLDADFEPTAASREQPEDWLFARARGECAGKWDSEHQLSGKRSLRLAIPKDDTARAHWRYQPKIPLQPDTAYRLSMKIMAVNVTGEAYAICYENGIEAPANWHVTRRAGGTHDWLEYGVEFVTRSDAQWLRLILKLRHGTGYAWFDDVKLEQIDARSVGDGPVRVFPPDDGFPIQAMWQPAQWTQHGIIHLARGHMNPIALYFWGDKAALDEPAIVLEATEGIALRGPVVKGRAPMPKDVTVAPDTVTTDGTVYRVWRLPIPIEALQAGFAEKPSWGAYHHVYANVAPDCPGQGKIAWRMRNAGKLGPRHELPVRVTAQVPPPITPPEGFRIYVQHTGALRHPDPAVRKRLVDYLATAGIVGGLSMTYWEPDRVDADRQYAGLGMALHTWRFDAYGGQAPEERRLVDSKGERSTGRVCPQAQIERVQPWYDNLKASYRARLADGLKRLIIDYEPPTSNACFCPQCRAAFAQRFGLPTDRCAALEPKQLQETYRTQWGRFRAEQNGAIVKLHCQVIHEVDPEVQVGLCSWPGTEAVAAQGGDIRLFEPHVAFHAPMIYTHGLNYHKLVRETCERTTAPVLPFIELADISQPRSLTPGQLRMNLLATGLSGGAGAFMWVGMECFDAQYMAGIARAVGEIDRLRQAVPFTRQKPPLLNVRPETERMRDITIDGRQVDVFADNPLPYVRAHVWGAGPRAMAAVLNYDPETSYKVRVCLAKPGQGAYSVTSDLTGRAQTVSVSADKLQRGLVIEIPPEGLAAVAVSNTH